MLSIDYIKVLKGASAIDNYSVFLSIFSCRIKLNFSLKCSVLILEQSTIYCFRVFYKKLIIKTQHLS